MKQTVSKSDFRDAFQKCGRGEQFSYDALGVIFDYLEELEENDGIETELDPIAVCCEFTEYKNIKEFQEAYSTDYETIEDISNETTVLEIDKYRFVIIQF